jgi:hypothetical protein
MKQWKKNPFLERSSKYGRSVRVFREENGEEITVREYFVSPEEVRENARRALESHEEFVNSLRNQNA